MSATYFYMAFTTKVKIPEENIILGIIALYFVCNCFIYSNLGFLSITVISNVASSYLIICYAGTKSVLRYLYLKDRENYYKALIRYCLVSAIYVLILLTCNQLAVEYRNNFYVILPKAFIPFYTGIIFYYSIKYKKNITGMFLLNLNVYAFVVSLYEWVDFGVYLNDMKFYSNWGDIYVDRTYKFDAAWLIISSILWLFVPRIIHMVKNNNKG
jgi:hypothetical protein